MGRILAAAVALLLVVLAPAGIVHAGHKAGHGAGGGPRGGGGGDPPGGDHGGGGQPGGDDEERGGSPSPPEPTPSVPVPPAPPSEPPPSEPPPSEPPPSEPTTSEPVASESPASEPSSPAPPRPPDPPDDVDEVPASVEQDEPISVTVLGPGDVRVELFPLSGGEISGFRTLEWAVRIEAAGSMPASPYRLRFDLDNSLFTRPYPPEAVAVFRGGGIVGSCADALHPCVESRIAVGGAVSITVRTTQLNTFAFGVPTSGCPAPLVTDSPFVDASELDVACLATWDLSIGVSPGTFAPDTALTRGQLATFAVRLLDLVGVATPTGSDAFGDDDRSIHAGNVDRVAAAGLVRGFADGTYRPGLAADSGQMASVVIAAYVLARGADVASPASHAAALSLLANLGVLGDVADPDAPLSRGAFAIVLTRLLDRLLLEGLFFPAA